MEKKKKYWHCHSVQLRSAPMFPPFCPVALQLNVALQYYIAQRLSSPQPIEGLDNSPCWSPPSNNTHVGTVGSYTFSLIADIDCYLSGYFPQCSERNPRGSKEEPDWWAMLHLVWLCLDHWVFCSFWKLKWMSASWVPLTAGHCHWETWQETSMARDQPCLKRCQYRSILAHKLKLEELDPTWRRSLGHTLSCSPTTNSTYHFGNFQRQGHARERLLTFSMSPRAYQLSLYRI